MPAPARPSTPLTPTTFHIILALSEGPKHGYAVMQTVSAAGVNVGPGTVYGALHRMLESGWVKPSGEEKARGVLGKRQRYALTAAGWSVLKTEARRILDTADLVRAHHILADDA